MMVFLPKLVFGFTDFGVKGDAINRADLLALGFGVVPDTFCAFVGVDDVNISALRNSVVWTFGFTYIAVDAFVGNH